MPGKKERKKERERRQRRNEGQTGDNNREKLGKNNNRELQVRNWLSKSRGKSCQRNQIRNVSKGEKKVCIHGCQSGLHTRLWTLVYCTTPWAMSLHLSHGKLFIGPMHNIYAFIMILFAWSDTIFVCQICHWIVKQTIENKQNLFLKWLILVSKPYLFFERLMTSGVMFKFWNLWLRQQLTKVWKIKDETCYYRQVVQITWPISYDALCSNANLNRTWRFTNHNSIFPEAGLEPVTVAT